MIVAERVSEAPRVATLRPWHCAGIIAGARPCERVIAHVDPDAVPEGTVRVVCRRCKHVNVYRLHPPSVLHWR